MPFFVGAQTSIGFTRTIFTIKDVSQVDTKGISPDQSAFVVVVVVVMTKSAEVCRYGLHLPSPRIGAEIPWLPAPTAVEGSTTLVTKRSVRNSILVPHLAFDGSDVRI